MLGSEFFWDMKEILVSKSFVKKNSSKNNFVGKRYRVKLGEGIGLTWGGLITAYMGK